MENERGGERKTWGQFLKLYFSVRAIVKHHGGASLKGGISFNLWEKSHLWDKVDEQVQRARLDEGKPTQEKLMGKVEEDIFYKSPFWAANTWSPFCVPAWDLWPLLPQVFMHMIFFFFAV